MEHGVKAFRHLDEYTFNWSDFFFLIFFVHKQFELQLNLQQTTLEYEREKKSYQRLCGFNAASLLLINRPPKVQ